MRIALLFLIAATIAGAELEQVTLTDGRRFIGYYDETAGTLTVEGPPKAVIRVAANQVLARSPYVRPVETDPVKRDEAELVRLESDHAAAIADAERLRKFASTRSGKDAETATAQANERVEQAARIADKIEALRAKVASAKPALLPDTKPTAPVPVTSEERLVIAAKKAHEDAEVMRDKAIALEFDALLAWLSAQDLSPLPEVKLGEDPRQSDVQRAKDVRRENAQREHMAKVLRKAKAMRYLDEKERFNQWAVEQMKLPEGSAARLKERERQEKDQNDASEGVSIPPVRRR